MYTALDGFARQQIRKSRRSEDQPGKQKGLETWMPNGEGSNQPTFKEKCHHAHPTTHQPPIDDNCLNLSIAKTSSVLEFYTLFCLII